jgi:hypothetical protein
MASSSTMDALVKLKAASAVLHSDLDRIATGHPGPGVSFTQALERLKLATTAIPQLVMAVEEIKAATVRMTDIPTVRKGEIIDALTALADLATVMAGMVGDTKP